MSIPETNIYRCLKMCSNCPFADNGKSMYLEGSRVDSIKNTLLSDDHESFNCHKTIYELDKSHKDHNKMCAGAYNFLREHHKSNIQMRFAYAMGIDTPPIDDVLIAQ